MITINLSKPGELDVQLNLPASWDELYPDEILRIAKCLISGKTPENIRAEILLFIIDTRAKAENIKLPKAWRSLIDPETFFIEGNSLLDFIFKQNELTEAPEKVIKLQAQILHTVYAPGNAFNTLICGEFEDAEECYNQFIETEKIEHLAKLAAILWRPKNVRYLVPGNGELKTYAADKWATLFAKLEPHRLYSIFIWYLGCKNLLPKRFPVMHEPDDNMPVTPDPMAFTKCIHAGAGPKNGKRDEIRLMLLNEFLFDMEQEAVKAKELK
jgi:hypothetical protein